MGVMTDVAVIGAGPYGLSLAAHLRARGADIRVFGFPMQSWRELYAGGDEAEIGGVCFKYF